MSYVSIISDPQVAKNFLCRRIQNTKGRDVIRLKQQVRNQKSRLERIGRLLRGHTSSDWQKISNDEIIFTITGVSAVVTKPSLRKTDFPKVNILRENQRHLEKNRSGAAISRVRILQETVHFSLCFVKSGKLNEFKREHPMAGLYATMGTIAMAKGIGFLLTNTSSGVTDAILEFGTGASDLVMPNVSASPQQANVRERAGNPAQQHRVASRAKEKKSRSAWNRDHNVLLHKVNNISPDLMAASSVHGYIDQVTPIVIRNRRVAGRAVEPEVLAHPISTLGLHLLDQAHQIDSLKQCLMQGGNTNKIVSLPFMYTNPLHRVSMTVANSFSDIGGQQYEPPDVPVTEVSGSGFGLI